MFVVSSFQVHEKSILLAAVPVSLHLMTSNNCCSRYSDLVSTWFLLISSFSMLPLLLKDGLGVATLALNGAFLIAADMAGMTGPREEDNGGNSRKKGRPVPIKKPPSNVDFGVRLVFVVSLLGAMVLSVFSVVVPPPGHLPDLWPVLVSVFSAVHFGLFYLYFNKLQWDRMVAMEEQAVTKKKK